MKQTTTNLIRSFIIIPLVATSVSMNAFTTSVNEAIGAQTTVIEEKVISPEEAKLQEERELKAAKINAFYAKNAMPLEGHGMQMVLVAEKYGLDPYLLPAIAVREQSGGKVLPYNCPGRAKNYNTFGWASGKICFTSFEKAIDTVGMKLGTLSFYKGKTTFAKLQTFNPPSVIPRYAHEVMAIMKKIENTKV